MATYNSDKVTANAPISAHGLANNVKVAYAIVTCAASPATTDTINFFDLPAGARAMFWTLKASDMDTNGSPALALNVGDSGSASRIFSASTVGQAGTEGNATAVGAIDYAYATKTRITGTASTNAATGAAGTIELACFYVIEGLAS